VPQATFNIAASADDEIVYRDGGTYPPTGAVQRLLDTTDIWADRGLYSGPSYRILVALMRWDTSSLPDDCVVTGATLRLRIVTINNNESRSATLGWYLRNGTDTDHATIKETNPHAGTLLSTITNNTDNDFVLLDVDTGVNKSGYTGLRLHISGTAPTVGENSLWLAAFDNVALTEPRLIVDYIVYDETMRPTGVSGLSNLTGLVTDIDQDPDGTITDPGLIGTDPSSLGGLTNGPQYPNLRAGASTLTAFAWNTPANVQDTSDSTLAIEPSASTAKGDYFTFAAGIFDAIPSDATITAVQYQIKHRAGTTNRATVFAQLGTANGTLIGTETTLVTNLGTTAGGITNNVNATGTLPTRAQLVGSTFGLRLRLTRSNTTTYELYSIKLLITYSAPQTVNTQADVALGDPATGTLETGSASGHIRARIRKKGTGASPQGRIELRNASGSWSQAVIANTTITESDADGQLLSGTFDQSIITDKNDVVARFVGTGAAGGLAELVAVEWNAMTTALVQPIKLVGAVGIRGEA
jgi:hypothetical protein